MPNLKENERLLSEKVDIKVDFLYNFEIIDNYDFGETEISDFLNDSENIFHSIVPFPFTPQELLFFILYNLF